MTQMIKMTSVAEVDCVKHRYSFLLLLLLSHLARGLEDNSADHDDPLSPLNFTFQVGNHEEVTLTFRETSVFVLMLNSSDYVGNFELRSADPRIFVPTENIVFTLTENTTFPFYMNVSLRGGYVGNSELEVFDSVEKSPPIASAIVNVHPPFQTLGNVATIILTIWLVISYVIMAAKVEPRVLLEKIKPPWGIIMGMVCQFVLMPPLAYAIAKVFGLTGALAVGLVLVGTCPGGFFSNIEVLLLDCDFVLSLTMTTFSTFIAVGMMPLNLFIYAQPFVAGNDHLETPFKSLLIQLCGLVMPLVLGVPFFYRFTRAREVCLKLVKPFTFILMVLGVVLFIPSQYYIFYSDWKVWTTSAILPVLGAFLGVSIARIANFNYTFSVTVAIETGCQNTLLAVSVAKLYYENPESDIVAIIPLLIAMVTGFEGIAIAALYYLGLLIRRKLKKGTDSSENVEGGSAQMECTERNGATAATANGETNGLQYFIPTEDGNYMVNGECTPVSEKPSPLAVPTRFGAEENETCERREKSLYPEEPPDSPPNPRFAMQNGCVNNGFMAYQHEWM